MDKKIHEIQRQINEAKEGFTSFKEQIMTCHLTQKHNKKGKNIRQGIDKMSRNLEILLQKAKLFEDEMLGSTDKIQCVLYEEMKEAISSYINTMKATINCLKKESGIDDNLTSKDGNNN